MKKRLLQALGLFTAGLLLSTPVLGYDLGLARDYAKMFEPVAGAKAGKELHLIKADQFIERVRRGEHFTTVDIRTPGEIKFFTGNMPGHLSIPMAELFERDNLDRLPEQGNIVIICHTGVRATAAVTALRSIGFKDTYVLKGGFASLATFMGPMQANAPLKMKTAGK